MTVLHIRCVLRLPGIIGHSMWIFHVTEMFEKDSPLWWGVSLYYVQKIIQVQNPKITEVVLQGWYILNLQYIIIVINSFCGLKLKQFSAHDVKNSTSCLTSQGLTRTPYPLPCNLCLETTTLVRCRYEKCRAQWLGFFGFSIPGW